jgi:hypothetical protein
MRPARRRWLIRRAPTVRTVPAGLLIVVMLPRRLVLVRPADSPKICKKIR